ncbi:peptidoglycan-binding protein [Sphaerisporangium sp. NBC_01403]|uniref:peptidoglycan-binding protein n=1 Tax=Sphaerisporangium sp. NBC_01403 TaxID=2903599 RepID=UPI00324C385B
MTYVAEPTENGEKRGRWRGVLTVVAVGVVTVAVTGGVLYARVSPPERQTVSEPLPPGTEKVVRGDLVSEVRAFGSLQFSGARGVKNQLSGITTWMPRANSVIERGERLYAVDDMPVVLLHGELPAWREFKAGMQDGKDVRMLEENLAVLGYDGFTVDDKFSEKTEAAVKRWQKNTGLPLSGRIELGRVVFTPGALRITTVTARPGDRVVAGLEVLRASGSGQRVSAEVPAAEQDLAVKGAGVEVELPDGRRTKGTVSSVGTLKTNKDNKKIVPITVRLRSTQRVKKFQSADVVVLLRKVEAENVFSVPVTALLPLSGGGYEVQIVDGGRVRRVKVKTGVFANGRAAISVPGIAEGMRVGVPKL